MEGKVRDREREEDYKLNHQNGNTGVLTWKMHDLIKDN